MLCNLPRVALFYVMAQGTEAHPLDGGSLNLNGTESYVVSEYELDYTCSEVIFCTHTFVLASDARFSLVRTVLWCSCVLMSCYGYVYI